jgi:hypothetical protein
VLLIVEEIPVGLRDEILPVVVDGEALLMQDASHFGQNHWKRSISPGRRLRSSTSTKASGGKRGECGTPAGVKMVEPSGITAISFAPGGLHVMLLDVQPLKAGSTFALTLEFEKAGRQDVAVAVRSTPPQSQHPH